MALREDYYTPCTNEIIKKIELIDGIIEEITPSNYDEEFGMENSNYSEDVQTEIEKMIDTLNEMRDFLTSETGKLADDISDVGGWF